MKSLKWNGVHCGGFSVESSAACIKNVLRKNSRCTTKAVVGRGG